MQYKAAMSNHTTTKHLLAEIQARNVFFSIASHELKNPLAGLKLQAEMASRKLTLQGSTAFCPEVMKKIFDNFNRDINRMMRLVDEMTDVAKICNGKFSLEKEYLDLNEYLRGVVERLKLTFPAFNRLENVHLSTPLLVRIDPVRMEQVMSNLISNAIKYGNNSPITLKSYFDQDNIYITVSDLGPGIQEKDQTRIFKLFERISSDTQGLGLGLFICHEIIKAHSGVIHLKSSPGNGSTFTLKLPLA
jgi:signal transduction histidine kinase